MAIVAFIFGILIGLAAGAAFHFRRAAETKRALDASNYLRAVAGHTVDILAREVVRRDQTLANIKALALRVHTERVLALGGSVSLPDPARPIRQRLINRIETAPLNGAVKIAGQSRRVDTA